MTEAPAAQRWRAVAALLAGACVIGFSPIFVRLAETGPAAAGFWRLTLALPALAVMTRQTAGGPGRLSPLLALTALMFALDLGFWHYGVRYTTVANATVLSNLAPVVVTGFAWIVLKERPRALFLAAMGVALAGAILMSWGRTGRPGLNPPLGDALAASTALWYALYMLAVAAARRTETASRVMFWSSALGAPLLLATALLLGERVIPAHGAGWLACIGLGAVHVAGQGAIAWAMGRLPTPTASVVVLVQPGVAALLGWLIFAEPVGPLQGAGAGVALAGVVLAQWASRPGKPTRPSVSA